MDRRATLAERQVARARKAANDGANMMDEWHKLAPKRMPSQHEKRQHVSRGKRQQEENDLLQQLRNEQRASRAARETDRRPTSADAAADELPAPNPASSSKVDRFTLDLQELRRQQLAERRAANGTRQRTQPAPKRSGGHGVDVTRTGAKGENRLNEQVSRALPDYIPANMQQEYIPKSLQSDLEFAKLMPSAAPRKGRPTRRKKVNRPKNVLMLSMEQWLETERGVAYKQLKKAAKQYYVKEKGGRTKQDKDKKIEAMLAPTNIVEVLSGKSGTAEEKKQAKKQEHAKAKALERYPPRAEILEHWPPPRCGPMLMSTMQTKVTINKWDYPKNPDQMECLTFKRNQTCPAFEQCGWCAFHHPWKSEAAEGMPNFSGDEAGFYTAWLEAATAGNQKLLKAMMDGGPEQPKADVNYVAAVGTTGIKMSLQGKSAASICARLGYCGCLLLLLQNGCSRKKSEHEIHSLLFSAASRQTNGKDVQQTIQVCLDNRISVCELDEDSGQTVLHSVIDKKNYEIVPFLLDKMVKEAERAHATGLGSVVDINHIDCKGFSPLHVAVAKGCDKTVLLLLQARAHPNTQAKPAGDLYPCPGSTPLGTACKKGFRPIVELLLQHKASIDANAFVSALMMKDQAIYAMLENANSSAKPSKQLVLARNKDRSGAVHVACSIEDEEEGLAALTRVLELGEAAGKSLKYLTNAQTTNGVAPLSVACRVGNLAIIRHLVCVCKVDTRAQDVDGNTALHHTENLMEGSDDVILLVCKKGGGETLVEIKNKLGQVPLLPSRANKCKMQ